MEINKKLNTNENVQIASSSLRAALNYKTISTAAGGALIGTAVGGPIGIIIKILIN